jgi:diguanylate cyclase (GGDEF)-like protein
MVATLRVVDAEVQAEQALDRRARTDELTNLPNRKEAFDRLVRLAGDGGHFAVLWCDIDRFKAINDSHGHAAGDTVLRVLAERIRGVLRSRDDIAARIGGDELLVILRGVHGLDDAIVVAEKLRRRAAQPIPLENGVVQATLSIGVTLAGDHEGIDAILARADEAMYRAKAGGRDRVVAIAAR